MNEQKDVGQSHVFNMVAAAKYLGISKTTLYTFVNDGSIPVIRLGEKRVGIALKDLEQYVEERRVRK